MEENLRIHMEHLFEDVPQTAENIEMKEEILQNITDKYHDLLEEGKSVEAAYSIAISSIGDIRELLGDTKTTGKTYGGTQSDHRTTADSSMNDTQNGFAQQPFGTNNNSFENAPQQGPTVNPAYEEAYFQWKKRSAWIVPISVMLYILCIIPPILAEACNMNENIAAALMFVMIALATSLLVYNGNAKPQPSASTMNAGKAPNYQYPPTRKSTASKILIALLILAIIFFSNNFFFRLFHINFGNYYSDASRYEVGNTTLPADRLDELSINWIDGSITIVKGEGEQIEIEENAPSNLSQKKKVHYYYDNGKLKIQYAASRYFSLFGSYYDKDLTVRIPAALYSNLSKVSIDSVSSEININDLTTRLIDIDNTSGNINVENVTVTDTFNIDNISGHADLSGSFSELSIDTTSGDCNINTAITPKEFELDSVSGNCFLSLPADAGFTLESDTVSGNVDIEFATQKSNDKYICGNGTSQFETDTVSGDIIIRSRENKES